MFALLSWRVWAGVAIAIALAASHFKAYHAGGVSARAELQAYQLEATTAAAAASEAARKKETELNLSVERVKANYAKAKRDNLALSGALDDSLRQFQSALGDQTLKNPLASSGTDGAGGHIDNVLRDSASTLAQHLAAVATQADRLEAKVIGLQDYVRLVCK